MQTDTLGTLRAELRARLGYSAAGAAAGVNQEHLNSTLREAQRLIYEATDWARLRKYSDVQLGVGQYLIDYPVNANPDRIKAISVLRDNVWSPPLEKGIRPEAYTNQNVRTAPYKWEPYEQIELFPISDRAYTVRVFFMKKLGRFTQDDDLSTVDRDMILIIALSFAKAHYRHPDAQLHITTANDLLSKLKAQGWGKSVFRPQEYELDSDPLPKPVVA